MAKVIGPLFSQEARGQFGKSLVFTRRRGQNIVRGYAIPSNPQTADQIKVRIILATVGLITKRVRATDWEYLNNAQTWRQFWGTRVTTGEVWNSALGKAMLGPGNATHDAALVQYTALTDAQKLSWKTIAEGTVGGLIDYVRGTTTVESGFMLFLAEKASADAGYGDAFVPGTPVTLVAG